SSKKTVHATFGVSRPSLHKWKIRHATTISIAKHASINLGPQYATRCNRLAVPRRPPAASLAGFPNPTTTALRRGSPPVRCPKRQARARDTSALPIHFAQVQNRQGPQYATRCNRLAVPRRPPAASLAGFPNPTTTALRRGAPPVPKPSRFRPVFWSYLLLSLALAEKLPPHLPPGCSRRPGGKRPASRPLGGPPKTSLRSKDYVP